MMWSSKQAIKQHMQQGGQVLTKRHVAIGGIATAGILALTAVTWQVVASDTHQADVRTTQSTPEAAHVEVKTNDSQQEITSNSEAAQNSLNESTTESSQSLNTSTQQVSGSTTVTVNDQTLPVPENGSFHSSTVTNDGAATLDVNIQSHSSGENKSRTSTRINVDSSTRTNVSESERTR